MARNGSRISRTGASRDSSPSLRASSANRTSSWINSAGSSSRLRNGFLRIENRFCNCREGKPMSVTAAAPPNTINSAGGSTKVASEAPGLAEHQDPAHRGKAQDQSKDCSPFHTVDIVRFHRDN